MPKKKLTVRARIGKYRIERKLDTGGFGTVWQAYDTIEGVHVALKVPNSELIRPSLLSDFRKEIRLNTRLDHPNILPIKNADFLDGHLVVATPLGHESLHERMRRRMSTERALHYVDQMLDALAYAHSQGIIHCDIKPSNFILFEDDWLRLADFGIARLGMQTMAASGSGTVGYIAPEQAMGKPSRRSDVFSMSIIIWEMLAGARPEWPLKWPLPNIARVRAKVSPNFVEFLRKGMEVNSRRRFRDGGAMQAAFLKIRRTAVRQTR